MTGMREAFIFLQFVHEHTFIYFEGIEHVMRGVGRVRFLLDCGELLEVAGVLYIPGLRVSILSLSSLDDAGFSVVFQRRFIFTYLEGTDLVLMGHRIMGEYVVQGRPTSDASGWLSESSLDYEMDLE